MPGRNIALPLAALTLLLAAPAAATAGTIEVDPAAGSGCSGNTCKTISAALEKAAAGDTIAIKRGAYQEPTLDVTKDNVTLEAAPGPVAISSSSTSGGADVLRVSANGVTLRGLTVGVQPGGGSAVSVSGTGATLEGLTLVNQAKGGADVPTLEILAPSGTTTVRHSVIAHAPDLSAAGGAPGILGPANSALVLDGAQVISGLESGPAVSASGPSTKIGRTGMLANAPGQAALVVTSPATGSTFAKAVQIDSSVLAGATDGTGLHAVSAAGGLPSGSTAGDIDVDMTHVTIAGANRSVTVEALADSALLGDGKGSIAVRAARSIVHGAAALQNNDGTLGGLLGGANAASLTVTDSDTNVQASDDAGARVTVTGGSNTPDSALFADPAKRLYLLRHDAPVRDKGGAIREGEGDKDVEGEPRLEGAATDLGADEWHNKAPVARLNVPEKVTQNTPVTIDASPSFDPEAGYGGGLKEYYFDFGDGKSEVSATPTVQHTYPEIGSYRVRVAVIDVHGLVGAPAAATLQVTDGVAPVVRIAQPRNNATFALKATKRVKGKDGKVRTVKRARTFRFQGTAQDATGIDHVDLSFAFGSRTGSTCRYLDAKKNQIVGRPCSKPLFFRVAIRDGIWAYRTKMGTKLRVGSYLVTARATDKSGVPGSKTLRFKLK